MEVYAGFMEHTDHNVGRLIDAIDDLGILDDTLVYYIIGDNGASAEGTPNGTFNELMTLNGVTTIETPEFLTARIDKFGTPEAYNHYAVGWAHAMDTPYQWTKQIASHWGGTRNGTIVHWPAGIKARGEIRSQFSHVIDIAATVLDVAGLPEPSFVHGIQQMPYHGRTHATHVRRRPRPEHRETQYFEMFVNRGIYHKGWTAVTRHSIPWVIGAQLPALDDDVWELYAPDDWTQAHDLAAEQPDRLRDLQRLFIIEATKYNVLPLDDRRFERFNSDLAGRPSLIHGKTQVLFRGMGRLSENSVINIKNKSHAVTADIRSPRARPGWRHRRPGRGVRWLGALRQGRATGVLLQPLRAAAVQDVRRRCHPRRRSPGPGGVHLRRGRPGQGWRGDPLSRRQARSAKDGSMRPSRWRSRPTKPPTSARTPRHPSATTTRRREAHSRGASAGSRSISMRRPRTSTT